MTIPSANLKRGTNLTPSFPPRPGRQPERPGASGRSGAGRKSNLTPPEESQPPNPPAAPVPPQLKARENDSKVATADPNVPGKTFENGSSD